MGTSHDRAGDDRTGNQDEDRAPGDDAAPAEADPESPGAAALRPLQEAPDVEPNEPA